MSPAKAQAENRPAQCCVLPGVAQAQQIGVAPRQALLAKATEGDQPLSTVPASPVDAPGLERRELFGHPKGLAFLAFTEAWERFSYYGMSALLVLYMVNQLLLPGHVENVAGFATFRGMIEGTFGLMSTQALASQIFGLYSGFVYFTPVLGGWLGDRIGQRNAVVLGALSMSGGHLAMAFDRSFLLALLLLIIGSGLLKGNISAQVGSVYPPDDEERRSRGFAIFSTGINFGAVAGPLLCGYLGERFGWHVGFGAAALFMLGALATYLSGYRYLPARVERKSRGTAPPLTGKDRKVVLALLVAMAITVLPQIAYYQLANVLPVWLQGHANMSAGKFEIPIPWYQSIDPLFSIIGLPLLFALWSWQGQGAGEPSEMRKIAIGSFICGGANLILVAAILLSTGQVLWIWPFLYCAVQGIGFMYFWPPLLSLVSRVAPARINATMMGSSFLVLFVANNLIGSIGTFYERMSPAEFWGMHAGIGAAGGVLALLFGRTMGRILEPQPGAGSSVRSKS
ncbi:peptide MFS transporter [Sphingomonas hankyongi]|uniref:Peptide MFS transporter n=1 Tax=Sphingomonas hankyongi TaxID=2908209 RepID=A0ABT0S2Z5_9SPHN|nr:peptide MFS transporter [Sphingomonas hankyongi]MCL6729905.1 peptide MFS transporter [Sphingomonas hankyongi]